MSLFNGYATEICVKADMLYPLPKNMTLEQAAGFPAVYMTAYHALLQLVVIRSTDKAIVHSAAGGVGSALLQLCRIKGIETAGVVGSSHKVQRAKELGATYVIDKSTQDLWPAIKNYTLLVPMSFLMPTAAKACKRAGTHWLVAAK